MTITFEQAYDRIVNDPEFESFDEKWADADFQVLKDETGCVPPPQLERILRELGAFAMGDYAFQAIFETGDVLKAEVQIPVTTKKSMISAFRSLRHSQEFPGRFPHDMVFFGTALAGRAQLLMHSAEKEDGAVYLWPVSGIPWGEPGNHQGLGKVTDTLYEFFYYMTDWDNI